ACSQPNSDHSTAAFLQALVSGQTSAQLNGLAFSEVPSLQNQLSQIVNFRLSAGLTQSATQTATNLVNSLVAIGQVAPSDAAALIASIVQEVPAGPAITSPAAVSLLVGSAASFTITTTGSPAPAITESGALPGGVSFLDNGNGTASLAGTPTV